MAPRAGIDGRPGGPAGPQAGEAGPTDAGEPAAAGPAETGAAPAGAADPIAGAAEAAADPAGADGADAADPAAGGPAAGEVATAGEDDPPPASEETPDRADRADSADPAGGGGPAAVPGRRRLLPATLRGRLVAAALALVLAVGAGGVVWWRAGVLPDGVAFAVRDTEVTVAQLDRQAEMLTALYGLRAPSDPAGLDRFRRDLAQASAVGLVIEQASAQRGLAVSAKVAQDTLTGYVEQFFGQGPGARDDFVRALGAAHTTEADVLAEIERRLLVRDLFGLVTKDVTVTPDEVRAAFDRRRAELGLPERRELRNIVVPTREDADRVAAELAGGADFAKVAAARSLDESTRGTGGALGTLARDQLEQGYADAAFGAAPGAAFGPVQTRFGWNVGIVGQVLAPEPAVFEQVQEQLTEAVRLEKATAVWRGFLAAEVEDAGVRYAEDYRPVDPAAIPEQVPAAGEPAEQRVADPAAPAPPR